MKVDPFYQAGMIDLKNVRPFEEDPAYQYKTAPTFQSPELYQAKESKMGYTYPSGPEIYVKGLDKPTMETAATTTHEGIHKILPQELRDAVARDAGSALGPIGTFSSTDAWLEDALRRIEEEGATFEDVKGNLPSKATVGADFARDEIITRYLENQIYGDEVAPFEEWMGEVDPYGDKGAGAFNYITMMRPGQGPLGREGIMKLLARKVNPYLKKVARRAHQNIESRYKPYIAPTGPPRGGGADVMPIPPPKKKYVAPPRGGGADVMPTPPPKKTYVAPPGPHGNGGGDRRGSMPTRTAGRNPWGRAHGGLIDIPFSGRSRYI